MRPRDLEDVLRGLNEQAGDDVAFDPDEILTVIVGSTETMKLTPAWTATTSTQTNFVWGPFASGTGKWGLQQWS